MSGTSKSSCHSAWKRHVGCDDIQTFPANSDHIEYHAVTLIGPATV